MPGPQSEMSPGMVAPNQELIDAVVNAHSVGGHMKEDDALSLLVILGMEKDEADELLADARLCACED
jgi:hypothetical protein